MLKDLVKMASKLDSLGLTKEADTIDALVRKMAGEFNDSYGSENPADHPLPEDPSDWTNTQWEDWESKVGTFDQQGIGSTEPIFDDESPEVKFVTRSHASKILSNMSDEEFDLLNELYPEAMNQLFGRGTLMEVKRPERKG